MQRDTTKSPESNATGACSLPPRATPGAEAAVFALARRREVGHLVAQLVTQARLRTAIVAVLSVFFWGVLFGLFLAGFDLLRTEIMHVPTRARTVQTIFNAFFLALLAMLAMSSAIILYGALFRSDEVRYLMTTPARGGRIVLHKFFETVVFSCWGFFLLASPMLIAYGIVGGSPWYFYLLIVPFLVSFAVIPTAVGGIVCLTTVYLIPRLRRRLFIVLTVLLAAAALLGLWQFLSAGASDVGTPNWFSRMVSRLQLAQQRPLPSWWLTAGLLEAAHPAATVSGRHSSLESLMYLAVLLSNALLFHLVLKWTGGGLLVSAYSRLQDIPMPTRRNRPTGRLLERLFAGLCSPLPREIRILLVKDIRLFRRDPVQWAQIAIFIGLMVLYLVNIRRLQFGVPMPPWLMVLSSLNLAVVGLILATFTTRFIFPMISLEGRRFWLLGTLPLERNNILWSKLILACGCIWIPCAGLILLSDTVLSITKEAPWIVAIHQLTCAVLCLGLCSLAVGLGARLPNLREDSPSKIAAGFGGTLNLVLSALYIIAIVTVTAVPTYCLTLRGTARHMFLGPADGTIWSWLQLGQPGALLIGLLLTLLLGGVTTVVPMRLGLRAFRQLEF